MENFMEDQSQNDCIYANEGTYMIKAGPGSGKTFVLIKRAEFLLSKNILKPNQKILCLTFTNKAANDMKRKITETLNEEIVNSSLWIGTFHSFYYYIFLNYGHFLHKIMSYLQDPLDPKLYFIPSQKMIFDSNYKNFRKDLLNKFSESCDKIEISDISDKNSYHFDLFHDFCQDQLNCEANCPNECEAIYFNDMCNYFLSQGLISFDLLELISVNLFKRLPNLKRLIRSKFPIILIDEFQDCNDYQFQFVIELWKNLQRKNFIVVGDENQSIFRFNGSLVNIFNKFHRLTNAIEKKLRFNYRNPKNLLEIAFHLTGIESLEELNFLNENDVDLETKRFLWWSYHGTTEEKKRKILLDKIDYSASVIKTAINGGVTPSTIAVLSTINQDLEVIKDEFSKRGIDSSEFAIKTKDLNEFDYFCLNLQFFLTNNTMLMVDLVEETRLYLNKFSTDINLSLIPLVRYIFNDPAKEYSSDLKKKIQSFAIKFVIENKYETGNFLLEFLNHLRLAICLEDLIEQNPDEIRLSTHHRAKGLEFDIVIFFDFSKYYIEKYPESQRLAYTTITRTKKKILLMTD